MFVNKPTRRTNFSCMFISILYMCRANMCPSSEELTVPMRQLLYVTLCAGMHTRWSSTQSDTPAYQTIVHTVTYTRYGTDTVNSPDNRHIVAQNM